MCSRCSGAAAIVVQRQEQGSRTSPSADLKGAGTEQLRVRSHAAVRIAAVSTTAMSRGSVQICSLAGQAAKAT